ncbi:MAG: transposase [Methanophagales archaeon]|nr:transposase [Methanophagales archaeon]
MGKAGAKVGKGTRNDLHHDRHTVSLLTDHLVFSPKYKRKVLEDEVGEEIIRETCKELDIEVIDMAVSVDHVHKTFKKSFIKNASQSVGQGWEVVERHISGQKGYSYEKTDTVPVVVIDEEKENLERTKPGT